MINFLFGDVGSGKERHIVEQIRLDVEKLRSLGAPSSSAGIKKCYWLVPEQKTVICERALATELEPDAQLYAEVTSFTRFADIVFRAVGGIRGNYIEKSGKRLIMYRALTQVSDSLVEYKATKGRERGCVDMFLDVVGELKSYAISPRALAEASERLKNDRLRARIHDLVCVFEAYEQILRQSYSDPYDDIILLGEKLDEYPSLLEGASIYISSFFGFTGAQLGVIRSIVSSADNVTFAFDIAESDLGSIQYEKLSSTVKAIKQICHGYEISKKSFSDSEDFYESEAISYLSKNIWRFDAPCRDDASGITLMRPSNEFEECEAVASKIKELIMSGERYSSIAIIVRSADTYRGVIDYTLEKYGIPYYMASSIDIITKPLVRMLFSVIGASSSFGIRDITSFLRSGYSGIDTEDADELEGYMYRWGISGSKFENDSYWSANPDGYVTEPTPMQTERLKKITLTRQAVLDKITPIKHAFEQKSSVKFICRAIYNLFENLGVRETLRAEMAESDKKEAMELSQLYSELWCALDVMCEIIGDEILDRDAFLSSLCYVLEGVQIGTIPTGEDNVTIGEADSIRTDKIRHAFVLGVCEGEFPQSINDSPFFSDSDKEELRSLEIHLSESDTVRADSELLTFKHAISTPCASLTVSAPLADIRGKKKSPSLAFSRIIKLFPSLCDAASISLCELDKIYSERIAYEHSSSGTAVGRAIRTLLGISDTSAEGFSNDDEKIDASLARALLRKSPYLSQSRIEKFVSCHFQYYCTYLLGIKESDKISFGAREVGVLAHAVLEDFLREVSESSLDLSSLSESEINEKFDRVTFSLIDKLCKSGVPSARVRHLFNRLKSHIIIYIRELADESNNSSFEHKLFELPFSDKGVAPLKFQIDSETSVSLSGVVDRVDVYYEGDTAYVRVVDYKTGEKKFSLNDFEHGLELQLLIYLYTLCEMPEDSPVRAKLIGDCSRLAPGGVMYFPMRLGKSTVDDEIDLDSDEAIERERAEVAKLVRRSGLFLDTPSVISAYDTTGKGLYIPKKTKKNEGYFLDEGGFAEKRERLEQIIREVGLAMLSGDASASPLKLKSHQSPCEYCQFKAVCRRRKL